MEAVEMLAVEVGTKPACEAFGLSRATFYYLTGKRTRVWPSGTTRLARALQVF